MNYVPWIAIGISVLALVVSALSLWNSWHARRSSEDAQNHTQIVSFEQRKQEFRNMLVAENVLFVQITTELSWFPDSELLRNMVSEFAELRHQSEAILKIFDTIPTSPSTHSRLQLEETGALITISHKSYQDFLKILRENNLMYRSKQLNRS